MTQLVLATIAIVFPQDSISFDRACGARCVLHLLEKFGKGENHDLIETVSKLNDFNSEEGGTSFARISEYLGERDLMTSSYTKSFLWEYRDDITYILHTEKPSGSLHFLVREPNAAGDAVYWDGLKGYYDGLPSGYSATGNVMAIGEDLPADSLVLSIPRLLVLMMTFLVVVAVFTFLIRRAS